METEARFAAFQDQLEEKELTDAQHITRLKSLPYGEELQLERVEQLEKARDGLLNFTLATFPSYQINWHHRAFSKVLNRFARKEIKRLIVTMPPRTGKTQLFSRQLPAFIHGRDPNAKIIAASYGAELASANNRDVQRIIDSDSYRRIFPETMLAGTGSWRGTSTWIRNNHLYEVVGYRGSYRSVGTGGAVTGMGGDYILCDDILKNQEEADSAVYRDKIWSWFMAVLYTRLEKGACLGVTMTRWHEDDLIGRLLKHARENPEADQWEVVNFPAMSEEHPGPIDPRTPGVALWPEKYDEKELSRIKISLGTRAWSALYQQRPAPESGMIVQRSWWRFYDSLPVRFDSLLQAWDLTFTKSATSDYVVGVLLGMSGANIYLLDMIRDRMGFTQSIAAIKRMSAKWPQAELKLVEQAANGWALIDTLQHEVSGLLAVKPTGSKVARVNAISPRIEAGNVWLPSRELAPGWGGPDGDVVEEFTAFPAGAHDDICDAISYGVLRFMQYPASDFLPISIKGVNKFDF